ncbi:hypothetical protein [Streptomyces achromogenes]|uniref:hypothetical protein n=1 Tax=Streptomyces achromogenes TaxID=67255 RepID=UPI0036B986EC
MLISPDPHAQREFLHRLDRYISDAKRILDAWNSYSDLHTDLDGWPYDDHAYGLRQSRRDAETAAAFEEVRAGARHLLESAEDQLPLVPADRAQTRWVHQLGVLRGALDRLDRLNEEWLATQDSLPAGSEAFETALAEHHAECWSYLDDWATHGHVIGEINTAVKRAPSFWSRPPAARLAPATSRATMARR